MIGLLFMLPMAGGAMLKPTLPTPPQAAAPQITPAREQELLRRIRELQAELSAAQARSLRQRQEWIEYLSLIHI